MPEILHFLTSRSHQPQRGGTWEQPLDDLTQFTHFRSQKGLSEIKELNAMLMKLEEDLVFLPKEDLEQQRILLNPLVDFGKDFSKIAAKNKHFLPTMERLMSQRALGHFKTLLQISYRVHQKIEIVLDTPDPDENDPDFQQFLSDLAEKACEGPVSKASFSARESLGL